MLKVLASVLLFLSLALVGWIGAVEIQAGLMSENPRVHWGLIVSGLCFLLPAISTAIIFIHLAVFPLPTRCALCARRIPERRKGVQSSSTA